VGKPNGRPSKSRKAVVTLEVCIVHNFDETQLEIRAAVPGRDGFVERHWPMRNGYLEYATSEDCHAWVSSQINAGVYHWSGVQEVLPL
jgi:hypothetical protein